MAWMWGERHPIFISFDWYLLEIAESAAQTPGHCICTCTVLTARCLCLLLVEHAVFALSSFTLSLSPWALLIWFRPWPDFPIPTKNLGCRRNQIAVLNSSLNSSLISTCRHFQRAGTLAAETQTELSVIRLNWYTVFLGNERLYAWYCSVVQNYFHPIARISCVEFQECN